MSKIKLGSTGIEIEKNGFGCLPIQRISKEAAAHLLRKAADGGINYFDTARAYSDSEEKDAVVRDADLKGEGGDDPGGDGRADVGAENDGH